VWITLCLSSLRHPLPCTVRTAQQPSDPEAADRATARGLRGACSRDSRLVTCGVIRRDVACYGCRRTTASFDARTRCDQRRYEYLLPEWALDPDLLPSRPGWRPAACPAHTPDAAAASAATNGEAAAPQLAGASTRGRGACATSFAFDEECCARLNGILQEYVGTHNFHNFTPSALATQMAAQRCACRPAAPFARNCGKPATTSVCVIGCSGATRSRSIFRGAARGVAAAPATSQRVRLQHPWRPRDAGASVQSALRRNIISCQCLGVVDIALARTAAAAADCAAAAAPRSTRWVRCEIVGQSFVMNQIRKMIGLTIAVYRGMAPRDAVYRALDPARDFSTPMAPALGLFLVESMFATYNKVWCLDGQRPVLQLDDFEPAATKFKQVRT
jgi:tRNA U38,U39,U40 pseudouridine synthase TruA